MQYMSVILKTTGLVFPGVVYKWSPFFFFLYQRTFPTEIITKARTGKHREIKKQMQNKEQFLLWMHRSGVLILETPNEGFDC